MALIARAIHATITVESFRFNYEMSQLYSLNTTLHSTDQHVPNTSLCLPNPSLAANNKQAHLSVLKAANIVGLGDNVRVVPGKPADAYTMDIEALETAMREDRAQGLVPSLVTATSGSTSSCAVDDIRAIGEVCNR